MAISAATFTLNAAFLQEIKDDNVELRRLLDQLRDVGASASRSPQERRHFCALLDRLCDQLAMHFALEEAYGYFEDPAFVSTRVSNEVCMLRSQHGELYLEIRDIAEVADSILHHDAAAGTWQRLGQRFRDFRDRLESHETRENELIVQALYQDIGVGD